MGLARVQSRDEGKIEGQSLCILCLSVFLWLVEKRRPNGGLFEQIFALSNYSPRAASLDV